ncbi:hypothetical protein FXB39_18440 [Nocardioides sp. BGMRC 2183]|nr:hypothetical protein FXB39_18440 [Nocardioides sp. BGMRC 2183]
MARRLILHIGLMKSGTTYLQGKLVANRDRLLGQGVLFPGRMWADQWKALRDYIDFEHGAPGAWERLRAEIDAHPDTVLLSVEHFAAIERAHIERLPSVFPDTEITAIVTVRDLGRQVPSMWQEVVKNGSTWTLQQYVDGLREAAPPDDEEGMRRKIYRTFWTRHNANKIVRRWADYLGMENLTVVVTPPQGAPSDLLWRRFCEAAGLQGEEWDEPIRGNRSIRATSVALMRDLNEQVRDLPRPEHHRIVKPLANLLLPELGLDEPSIGFTVPDWLQRRSRAIVGNLESTGVRIIGDTAELDPVDSSGTSPDEVDASARLELAVAALAALLREDAIESWRRADYARRVAQAEAADQRGTNAQ